MISAAAPARRRTGPRSRRGRRAARWPAAGRRAAGSRPPSGSGMAGRPRRATAKWSRRGSPDRSRARRVRRPAQSVPVTTHTGAVSPLRVAAISPAPPASVRTAPPSSIEQRQGAAGGGEARVDAAGARPGRDPAGAPVRRFTLAHGPTITRSVSGAPPLPIAASAAGTPSGPQPRVDRGAGAAGDDRRIPRAPDSACRRSR